MFLKSFNETGKALEFFLEEFFLEKKEARLF
jgi:hypothetical protein